MNKFLRRLISFSFCLVLAFFLTYASVDYLWNSESADNTIFIWGDSQAYQGLNLKEIQRITGKRVLSAARHGAGIYDFLVFSQKVPSNSSVIVALSKPVQLRRKQKDRNWSGLSLNSLLALYKMNYSLYDISRIIKNNIMPKKLYVSDVPLYPYRNIIAMPEPISLFEDGYSKIPDYLDDKQELYRYGIKTLIKKNCKITFVEFPYHPLVEAIEKKSDVIKNLETFKTTVMALFKKHT
ncbi:MAG: hypothetical protein ACE5EZ_03200, partial [Thermodesulfobacteriota bacterium]